MSVTWFLDQAGASYPRGWDFPARGFFWNQVQRQKKGPRNFGGLFLSLYCSLERHVCPEPHHVVILFLDGLRVLNLVARELEGNNRSIEVPDA